MARRVKCARCGSARNLEKDHIIPKAKWPLLWIRIGGNNGPTSLAEVEEMLDGPKNRRRLCRGCHDYRHARESALEELDKALGRQEPVKVSMWLFRLGLIEAANTPELVRQRGYTAYWNFPETHYSRWYPKMQSMVRGAAEREQAKLA